MVDDAAEWLAIDFPESYAATNMAQGAPTEMRNALGERLQLIRDGQRNLQEILTPAWALDQVSI